MKSIAVNTEKPYKIIFTDKIYGDIFSQKKNIHIITDENVSEIYSLPKKDTIFTYIIPPGEEGKSFDIYRRISLEMLENGISRNDIIITFGGGAVGDLGGFIASTILRGVDYIQIPTTLLAMTDSSVGGKTAINTPLGKNLIGTFYQPKAVYINTDFLKTLPEKVFRDGMGEVVKYSLISDLNLADTLENIIYGSVKIKADIVSEDEKDRGIRKILNFGHTVGHAIEQYFSYERYTHGEAVAIGMVASAVISDRLNISHNLVSVVKHRLKKYSLPCELPETDKNILTEYISKDKKSHGELIDFILLEDIGKPIVRKMTPKEITDMIYDI